MSHIPLAVLMSFLAVCLPASAALPVTQPTDYYVVSELFSESAALWAWRILEVRPDGAGGSTVRFARIAAIDSACPRQKVVQAKQVRVEERKPESLLETANPCAVTPATLKQAIHDFSIQADVFESVRFGIVATCGKEKRVLRLPFPEKVDLDAMRQEEPAVAALWDLAHGVARIAFHDQDVFFGVTAEQDLELQLTGSVMAKDIRGGRFDAGFQKQNGAAAMAGYTGPRPAPDHTPRLVGGDAIRLAAWVPPEYPSMARHVQAQGTVELLLRVDPATGEVREVRTETGHPLLKPPAAKAAQQWRFEPGSAEQIKAVLDFHFHCEVPPPPKPATVPRSKVKGTD